MSDEHSSPSRQGLGFLAQPFQVTSAWRKFGPAISVIAIALVASACSTAGNATPSTSGDPTTTTASPPTTAATTATTDPPTTTTTAPPPTTTTTSPADNPKNFLQEGSTGSRVLALQQRLTSLGYWLGTPNGVFGDSTEQAVYAIQKAAGIERDGIVGPKTEAALAKGVVPSPRPYSGYAIQVDLQDDLVMFQTNGKIQYILNTSTGGGYKYNDGDGTAIAETPTGVFQTYREVDGMVTDNLGQLWMPKFFTGGFAIHGDSYVPAYPASHGCVRVSNEAIEWIWAQNLDPLGTTVWVYS
jgi:peptidoglycan hydrolase-like protein with peptidoglycan-binding domain